MNESSDIGKGWIEQPRNVDRIVHSLYTICAVVLLLDFIVPRHEHLHFAQWWGFYGWYGLISCVGLVIVAKGMRRVVMRPENYYAKTPSEPGDKEAKR